MAPDAEAVVALEGPYSLRATMRRFAVFGRDPTLRVRREETWVGLSTASGPASVRYEQRGASVHAAAWGPGAREAIAAAPEHLGRTTRAGRSRWIIRSSGRWWRRAGACASGGRGG